MSFLLRTVAMGDRFLSMLMLCGIQASLSNNLETLGLFKFIVTDFYLDLKEKSATSVFVIPTSVLVITTF